MLHAEHTALGASFRPAGEWELPIHYGDPLAEYQAIRNAAALMDRSAMGKLLFQGTDRREFFNGLLTNDIQSLPPGQGLHACLLTPKGKLLADFSFYDRGEDLLAFAEFSRIPVMATVLSKYLPLSDTTMEDVSGTFAAFFVLGPKAQDVFSLFFNKTLAVPPRSCRQEIWKKIPVSLFSYPPMAPQGLLLAFPAVNSKEIWNSLMEAGGRESLRPAGFQSLEMWRAEEGIPAPGIDSDEDSYPPEVNLDSAVSYTKGCYMGQETLARLKHHGRLRRRLVGLKINSWAASGADVFSGDEAVGKITTVVESPRLKGILALAHVPPGLSAPGTRLTISSDPASQAEVVALPVRP
jgi:folate-binding protein YgfZ